LHWQHIEVLQHDCKAPTVAKPFKTFEMAPEKPWKKSLEWINPKQP